MPPAKVMPSLNPPAAGVAKTDGVIILPKEVFPAIDDLLVRLSLPRGNEGIAIATAIAMFLGLSAQEQFTDVAYTLLCDQSGNLKAFLDQQVKKSQGLR